MEKINKIALVPSYEPNNNLITLLDELKENNFLIILINDGSNSNFNEIFKEATKYATLLTHSTNKGKGQAIKTGLQYIYQNIKGDYFVITMDSDGQHTVKDAIKLYNSALKNKNALILGKRKRDKNTPIRSKIGNNITRFIYYIITGLNIYDTQTGLRVFSNNLIPFLLDIDGERYEYEMNVLLECSKKHIPILEIQIDTIYINNNKSSHFKTLKDSLIIYKEIIKFLTSSILSFIIDYIIYIILLLFATSNITIANILSKIFSSSFNYIFNKKIVFNNKDNIHRTIIYYYGLVLLILNTLILNLLVNICSINQFLAKIFTEFLLFIINFIIQKHIIFNKKEIYERKIKK